MTEAMVTAKASGESKKIPDIKAVQMQLHQSQNEIITARSKLAATNQKLEETQRKLAASRSQVEQYLTQLSALRHSLSWRITRPLRILKRRR